MLDYLIKSGAILAILFLFYKLVLENAQMHSLKRGFLLFSLLAAFGIPLLVFTNTIYIPKVTETFVINEVISFDEPAVIAEKTNYLGIILMTIYGIGVFLFGAKFLVNLFYISKKIQRNPHHKRPPFTEVLLSELKSPYTFFNYIFLNKYKFESKKIPKEVLWHEEAHATQKHSIDVLCIEAIQVVFWFNPFLHNIKKAIKLNHEFLADEAVLNKGIPTKTYQQTILNFSSTDNYPQLSNALNYKPIKKRFTQMKTKTTKKAVWIKSLLILPLLAILIYSFSQKETKMIAQTIDETTQNSGILESESNTNGVTEVMMQEYRDYLNSSDIKNRRFIMTKYKRARAIYGLMSDVQRSGVDELPNSILNDIPKTTIRKMTPDQFEKFKDEKIYALWIDGKHVSNSILNNYKYSDIKHYGGSIVKKNARTEKHPQPNQYWLYTPQGFEKSFVTSVYERYLKNNAAYEKNRKATPHFKDRSKEDQLKLILKFDELGSLYFRLFSKHKKMVKRPIHPHSPYVRFEKDGKTVYKMRSEMTEEDFKLLPPPPPPPVQDKATAKQLATYNRLAKKYNAMLKTGDIYIKMGDIKEMKAIYAVMSAKQKKSAQPFPNFPPPPPPPVIGASGTNPPPPPPIPANATPAQKAKYKKVIEKYNKNQKNIKFKIDENGAVIPPPPPPPPSPPNPTDHMIQLAKEGANFYFEGKKISSDRAIELTKKNKAINIQVRELNGKKPEVKLSTKPIKVGVRDYPEIEEEVKEVKNVYKEVAVEEEEELEEIVESPLVEVIEVVERPMVEEEQEVIEEVREVELEEIVEEEIETPSHSTDHIIDLAKRGASFYYEGKSINSDKALDLIKKNPKLNMLIRKNNSNNPSVQLSKKPIRL